MQNKRPFKNVKKKINRPQTFEQYFIYNNRALKLKILKEFYKTDAKQRKWNPNNMWPLKITNMKCKLKFEVYSLLCKC